MTTEQLVLRPATADDLAAVALLYGRAMGTLLRSAGLNHAQQVQLLTAQWNPAEIRIILVAGRMVGWVQIAPTPGARFIRNFCIDPDDQRRGIGTAVLLRLIDEAARAGDAVTLGVAKGNQARALYQRLGFHDTHADAHHDYMRRD